jgi:hypothetical protein
VTLPTPIRGPRPTLTPEPPPALHLRAMDNLRFIRQTMEDAVCLTAVSGVGEVMVGCTALAAAWLAAHQATPLGWLCTWLGEALIAACVTGGAVVWKARQARLSLTSRPGRRFVLGLLPPLAAGALLTYASSPPARSVCCPACGCCSTAPRSSPAAPFRCASCR